jgi:hypothetical protein
MLRRMALIRTDVSEEQSASTIGLSSIGEVVTTLTATDARRVNRLLITANFVASTPILVTLMMEAVRFSKRRFLQERHVVTIQKTAFFIVTAVKTSNLIWIEFSD